MTFGGGHAGILLILSIRTEDRVLDDVDGQDFFLDKSTRRAWPGQVKLIRARRKALFRRGALDDSWTRQGCAHVYLERRFMVTSFDLLGWGVFVDGSETKATRGPSWSGLVALGSREPEAVTFGRGSRHRTLAARAARRAGSVRDALHGDGGKWTDPRRRSR